MIRPPFSRMADCAMENDGAKRVLRLHYVEFFILNFFQVALAIVNHSGL